MLPNSEVKEVTIKDYLVIVKRRFWIILVCFVIVSSWTALKSYKKINMYRATARLIIETSDTADLYSDRRSSGYYEADKDIASRIEVITSSIFAKKAVESLIASGDKTFEKMNSPEFALKSGLSANPERGTRIIAINYVSKDPIKAAKYANVFADAYIGQDKEKRSAKSRYTTDWYEAQVNELKKKIEDSENALNDYVRKNDIISIPDIERKTTSIMEQLKHEKVTVEAQFAEASKRYKAKHPTMIALTTRLESINKGLDDETKKLLAINDKMQEYNILKRDLESNKRLYDSLLQKSKEAEVTKDLDITTVRVIDYASVPRTPFSPDRKKDISQGLMMGLMLGAGLAFLLEYLDSTVKNADDIEMYVKLPFLGYVPSAKHEIKTIKDLDLIVHQLPRSTISEAYRSIRTSIIFSAPEDKPLKTVLITSAAPQEGKSTIAINLATVFANANEKVVLIDADMRRSRLDRSLGLDNRVGLSNFLTGISTLDEALRPTSIPNLFFISAGPHPPNPAELLTSAKTRQLFEELKKNYDRIIIDAPPIVSVADSSILVNIVDGVIDIIRAGFLNIDVILRGRQRIVDAKSRIIGVILNNVNVKKEDSYYYYHYYYAEEDKKKA